ncbi:hypothetical protein ACCS88_37250, partial [Rhizobium ruizarguesonis]
WDVDVWLGAGISRRLRLLRFLKPWLGFLEKTTAALHLKVRRIRSDLHDYNLPGGVLAEVAVYTYHASSRAVANGSPAHEQLDEVHTSRTLIEEPWALAYQSLLGMPLVIVSFI